MEKKSKRKSEGITEQKKLMFRLKHVIGKFELENIRLLSILSIAAGIVVIIFNYLYLVKQPQFFALVNLLGGFIAVGMPLLLRYFIYNRVRKLEELFPIFLADVNGNISVGMTLPQAIKETRYNDYDMLTPYVKEISAKIEWGISFERVLESFADKVGSAFITRTVKTVIETHRSGGEIGTVLESVSTSMKQIEKIKKERAAGLYSQMVNGYFIFFVFLGVMVGMSRFLFPVLQSSISGTNLTGMFNEMFLALIVIEGLFSGLGIGKMSEGTFTAGFKHSIALVAIGYAVYVVSAI